LLDLVELAHHLGVLSGVARWGFAPALRIAERLYGEILFAIVAALIAAAQ
jgi:hypothetical protein